MKKVSIVIPTLNEEGSIGSVISEVIDITDELIIVDGHSTDNTIKEVEKFPKTKILYDKGKKGSAVRKGMDYASGDILIMMDADGSHKKEEILDIIKKIETGYDVVMPSRFIGEGYSDDITPLRVIGNKFYIFWVWLLWKVKYSDICYGFRGFKRQAYKKLGLNADGFDIELEISIRTIKKNLSFIEIPSHEKEREFGEGKLNFWTSLLLDKRLLIELFLRK